jgi:diguanylate cyclase (GGDEF)-like protein
VLLSTNSGDERRFDWVTFAFASLAMAAVLVSLVAVPQWLSKQARFDALRLHVAEVANLAGASVDGDLHRKLLGSYSDELYAEVVAPLVRLHSADPDIYYLYTMVDKGREAYFVVDTAASPLLRTKRELDASGYMEKFEPREDDDWLSRLASGETYVTPTFEEDDYGTFLSAHAPIYDREGRHSGFVGVDFDMQYYLARESRFGSIAIYSLCAAFLVALLTGWLVTLYRDAVRRRVDELHRRSITDSLTGLLNRRGLAEAIRDDTTRPVVTSAVLLVDVDGLKLVNSLYGHGTGDVVLARVAGAIRGGIREGDHCARIGSEFVIYAPDCDAAEAEAVAQAIIRGVTAEGMRVVGSNFSISVGISVSPQRKVFSEMYREAGDALGEAKSRGRNRLSLYEAAA